MWRLLNVTAEASGLVFGVVAGVRLGVMIGLMFGVDSLDDPLGVRSLSMFRTEMSRSAMFSPSLPFSNP